MIHYCWATNVLLTVPVNLRIHAYNSSTQYTRSISNAYKLQVVSNIVSNHVTP
jgi:hypothetical protein